MKTLGWIVFVLIVGSIPCASADNNFSFYLGGWSAHLDASHLDLNGNNKFLFVEKNNYIGGYFENSFHQDSALLVKKWELKTVGDFNLNAFTGAVYSYSSCDPTLKLAYYDSNESQKVCPGVGLGVEYDKYKVKPNFVFFGTIVALTFRVEF